MTRRDPRQGYTRQTGLASFLVEARSGGHVEATGWKVGRAKEFLGLTPGEEALVEIKLGLARELKEVRAEKTVRLDLLVRSLVAPGSSRRRVARAIAK